MLGGAACGWRAGRASRRSSRRGRTPGRYAGAARRRRSRRQSSQPSTDAGSSVTVIVFRWVQVGWRAHLLEHRKAVKGGLRREAGRRPVDPDADRRRRTRGRRQRRDRVQPAGCQLELQPDAVLERRRACHRRVARARRVEPYVRGRVSTIVPSRAHSPVVAEEAGHRSRRRMLRAARGADRRRRARRRSGSAAGRPAPTPRRGRGPRRASPGPSGAAPRSASCSRAAGSSASRPANGSSSSRTSGATASRAGQVHAPALAAGQGRRRRARGARRRSLQGAAGAARALGRGPPTIPAPRRVGQHAAPRQFGRLERDRHPAVALDPSRCRRQCPGQRVERVLLAGAVGTRRRDQLAARSSRLTRGPPCGGRGRLRPWPPAAVRAARGHGSAVRKRSADARALCWRTRARPAGPGSSPRARSRPRSPRRNGRR